MVHSACYTALPNVLILKCFVDRGKGGGVGVQCHQWGC